MKNMIKITIIIILITIVTCILINIYVINNNKKDILKKDNIKEENYDCILILGAGVKGNTPSPMLEDRLLTGIDLYNQNVSRKIVVSGDHGKDYYDEVNVMKNYLIEKGIPSENIFMDHAGFSTYDSVYRIKEIFKAKKVIIVTQEYHLYRSLHISKELNLEAKGFAANRREYFGQIKRDIREMFAIIKDYIKCKFKPKPKYLGDIIPVSGDGNVTNDK